MYQNYDAKMSIYIQCVRYRYAAFRAPLSFITLTNRAKIAILHLQKIQSLSTQLNQPRIKKGDI